MKQILLIGCGAWGQKYLQFNNISNITVATKENYLELINSKQFDGVIIATQPQKHIDIAIEVLKNNIPVLIEKPLAITYEDASRLIPYQNNAPILVNHLHLFSPSFEKLNKSINEDIININSQGTGCIIRNYSSLIDYGCHDLAMGLFLTKYETTNIIKSNIAKNIYSNNNGINFDIEINYNDIKHTIKVGSAGKDEDGKNKQRIFEVETKKQKYVYDGLKNELYVNGDCISKNNISPLYNSFNYFLKLIDGYTDKRFGLDLSLKCTKILEDINNKEQ